MYSFPLSAWCCYEMCSQYHGQFQRLQEIGKVKSKMSINIIIQGVSSTCMGILIDENLTWTAQVSHVSKMLNKNTWGVKKCGVNQKQHCKQAGATKRFDIS